MSIIGVNVVYGGDTNFTSQAAASDSVTRWIETDNIEYMSLNPDGSGGSVITYKNGTSPYTTEIRVTQSPFQIAPSDTH